MATVCVGLNTNFSAKKEKMEYGSIFEYSETWILYFWKGPFTVNKKISKMKIYFVVEIKSTKLIL